MCYKTRFPTHRTEMRERYQAPRGTRDILPDEIERWHFLEETARDVFARYGFSEIRTPHMESTALFTRSVGATSDIVRKQMYTIRRGDESMTLRPENTAPVVRAFVQHALHRQVAAGYPEKYYYIGPMFRHERPQKGRQRQFHQIGVEVLGAAEPLADAETVEMVDRFLDALGIEERELLLGSVGDESCRDGYRAALRAWLEPHLPSLCEDCRRRYDENPLRVLDCKVDADRELLAGAPSMLDSLCEPCAEHFAQVRRWLDELGVGYRIDARLVRGLDYYRRTVFEVTSGALGAQSAILGGGRYDGLVEELGGPALPGVGFAMGMERAALLIPADRVPARGGLLAVVTLGTEGWEQGVRMAQRMRSAGLRVLLPLAERPMGAQLKRATRSGAGHAVFVGKEELAAGRFGFKDLRSGEQESLAEAEILGRLSAGKAGRGGDDD
jgi:histidyl-tRNA synthetase